MYDCTAMAAVWAADGVVAQTGTITDVTPPNSYSMQNKNPCPLQFYFGRIYHWAARIPGKYRRLLFWELIFSQIPTRKKASIFISGILTPPPPNKNRKITTVRNGLIRKIPDDISVKFEKNTFF